MHDRKTSSVCSVIGEWNRGRLVVILQHAGIVLHLVDERQFNSMTLELDSEPHFAARIPAGDVFATAPNAASWITGPYLRDGCLRRLCQREPSTPTQEVSLVEHSSPPDRGIRRAAGYFRFRKTRSFFSAKVYLLPASVMSF